MMRILVSGFSLFFLMISLPTSISNTQSTLDEDPQEHQAMTNLFSLPFYFTENLGQWGEKTLFKTETVGASFYFCKDEVAYLFVRKTDELMDEDSSIRKMMGMDDKFYRPPYKKEAVLVKVQFLNANPNPEVIGIDRLSHNNNYFYGNDPSLWQTNARNYSAIAYKDIYAGIDLKYRANGRSMKYDFIVNPGADYSQIRLRFDGIEDLSVTATGDLLIETSLNPVYEKAPSIYQEIKGEKREISGRYNVTEPGILSFALEEEFNPHYPLIIDPELLFSTYLGGSDADEMFEIALDTDNDVYVCGISDSYDFPLLNPYDSTVNGNDAVVSKFASSGETLLYSTFIGGGQSDVAYDITVDLNGNAYVTGIAYSSNFPVINGYDEIFDGGADAFVLKLSREGDSLEYSTFLGGGGGEVGRGICLDYENNAYITGYTNSSDFPIVNAYDEYLGGIDDVFITKLSSFGNSLIYSTYLGGSSDEQARGIDVDSEGNAFVTGYTSSSDFPVVNAYDDSYNGNIDVFVSGLWQTGDSLIYSTYIGGSDEDRGAGVVVDINGNTYITGTTLSSDFPTIQALDSSYNGDLDGFVCKMPPIGNSITYSSYFGGSGDDGGTDICVDICENVYITGGTFSPDFPTFNAYDSTYNNWHDVFVIKLFSTGNIIIYSTLLGGGFREIAYGISIDSAGSAYITGYTMSSDFPLVNPCFGNFAGSFDAFVAKFGPSLDTVCIYVIGDVNASGDYNSLDISFGVTYFKGGEFPICEPCWLCSDWYYCGDVNGSCNYNGLDITYGVRYLKDELPELIPCPDCQLTMQ
ncbi:MAG: SBBP repeat-containing protein [Candidatus Zixiibacteriota bacterium]|nr:MAG: SBBP repeat-containing protein [candidate division Zixibacteria bacterium]